MADLVVREIDTGKEVARVPVQSTSERHVEKVMRGMSINMGEDYYIDDSEVTAAREAEQAPAPPPEEE